MRKRIKRGRRLARPAVTATWAVASARWVASGITVAQSFALRLSVGE